MNKKFFMLLTVIITVLFSYAIPPEGKGPKKDNPGKHKGWEKQKDKDDKNDTIIQYNNHQQQYKNDTLKPKKVKENKPIKKNKPTKKQGKSNKNKPD